VEEFELGEDGQPDLFSSGDMGSGSSGDEVMDPGADWDPRHDPDDDDAWLAGLPQDIRAEVLAPRPAPWTPGGEPDPAAFATGGLFDTALPGSQLGQALASVTAFGHAELDESELLGVLRGWQRQVSYAQAELAAATIALAGRRTAGSSRAAEHLADEVAVELTLTGRSAGRLLDVVCGLRRLAEVHHALLSGAIDWARACVFVAELAVLDDDAAQEIAGKLAGLAAGWTTGQLRTALVREVLAVDPSAAERRKHAARRDCRVEVWGEPSGNAALAGRELRPAHVIAIDRQLTGFAAWLKSCGVSGTVDQLRALAYTTLLSGRELAAILDDPSCWPPGDPDTSETSTSAAGSADSPSSDGRCATDGDFTQRDAAADVFGSDGGRATAGDSSGRARAGLGADDGSNRAGAPGCGSRALDGDGSRGTTSAGRDRDHDRSASDASRGQDLVDRGRGGDWPRVTGTIHLTMPVSAWLGGGEPGEVAGHGPVDAASCRELAGLLARDPRTRWCLTVTGAGGLAAGHACAGRGRGPAAGEPVIGWAAGLRGRLQILQAGTCGHDRRSPGYAPPADLRHLIEIRQRTCAAPGCRRAAGRCDLDHTRPYDQGGRTCECNLAPLCRRHHRAKQAPGWQLTQRQPGVMTWRLPSGRVCQTTGPPYPG